MTVEIPKSILSIIKEKVCKYPGDLSKCVNESEKAILKLENNQDVIKVLVRFAVQDLVYDERSNTNSAVRKQASSSQTPKPKVIPFQSKGVTAACRSLFEYFIGGSVLGDITGERLGEIAKKETAISNGHKFNANLCRELEKIVPADKQVRDVVSERKLEQIFEKLGEPKKKAGKKKQGKTLVPV